MDTFCNQNFFFVSKASGSTNGGKNKYSKYKNFTRNINNDR